MKSLHRIGPNLSMNDFQLALYFPNAVNFFLLTRLQRTKPVLLNVFIEFISPFLIIIKFNTVLFQLDETFMKYAK